MYPNDPAPQARPEPTFDPGPRPDSISDAPIPAEVLAAAEAQTPAEVEAALRDTPHAPETPAEVAAAVEAITEDEKLDTEGELEALAYLKASHGFRLIDVLADYADAHVVRTVAGELRAELLAPFVLVDEEV